jgi:hypothetical protein
MQKPPLAIEGSGDIEAFRAHLRDQDAEFCRRMLIAIESGRETCPIGVSTASGVMLRSSGVVCV